MTYLFISLHTHRYYHVYCDNFFSSIALFADMLKMGLYACGTLRPNRKGFPQDLKPYVKKGMSRRGECEIRQYNNISVSVWQDSKPVTVVSTNADPTKQGTVTRKNKDGSSSPVDCPEATLLYNKYMGGVDVNDQIRGYYHMRMKCRKFYKYIFWFLVDLSITNAYILCKNHTCLSIKSSKDFRLELAKLLIGSYSSRKRIGRPSLAPAPKHFKVIEHYPTKGVPVGHKGYQCANCSKLGRRKEAIWCCRTCNKFLCHQGRGSDCFLEYHLSGGHMTQQ